VLDLDDARRRAEHRDRWRNQRAAAGLLRGERVADCQRSLTGLGVSVMRDDDGRASYAGVMCCDSRWHCPLCAAKITERDRRKVQHGIMLWTRDGGAVYLATQTFRHDITLPIGEGVEKMQLAQSRMKATRAYKRIMERAGALGSVKALEVTHGANGWHPHTHTLIFARADQLDVLEGIRDLWAAAVERVGLGRVNEHGFDVRGGDFAAEYVAKFGKEPSAGTRAASRAWWTASHELTKGHTKATQRMNGATPFTLLRWYREGDALSGALFSEYAHAFKGRAQLYWSRGLTSKIDLLELQEPKRPRAAPVKLLTIARADWHAILRHDARWEVLYVAERYGAAAVAELLDRMRRSTGRWRGDFKERDSFSGRMVMNDNPPWLWNEPSRAAA
jgi:hypothetical protein